MYSGMKDDEVDESGREDEKIRRRLRLRQRQNEDEDKNPRKNRLSPFSKKERQFDWRLAVDLDEEDEDGTDDDDDNPADDGDDPTN